MDDSLDFNWFRFSGAATSADRRVVSASSRVPQYSNTARYEHPTSRLSTLDSYDLPRPHRSLYPQKTYSEAAPVTRYLILHSCLHRCVAFIIRSVVAEPAPAPRGAGCICMLSQERVSNFNFRSRREVCVRFACIVRCPPLRCHRHQYGFVLVFCSEGLGLRLLLQ